MTAPGRQRKLRAFCVCAAFLAALIHLAFAGTTELIVIDRHSGLAISGYDPVAYFIDRKAVPGRDDIELALAGGVWRFRNEGNRAAFKMDPQVYMPSFGGYDPVGIARGVAMPGDPRLWQMAGARLYLFYSTEDQAAFALDAQRTIATADRKWPLVQQSLVH